MLTAAPSGGELETALRELLRKNHFGRAEHLSVQVIGPTLTPVYILTVSVEVARALRDVLDPMLGNRTHPSLTEWVLFRPDAETILKATQD
jgi:hypothetical protein